MRVEDGVALMTGLAIELRAADVTHRAICVGSGSFNAVPLIPHDGVIVGNEFLAGQVTRVAFHRDGTRDVAVHALGHRREASALFCGDRFIEIVVTSRACELGITQMTLMAEAWAVIGDHFEDESIVRFTERDALTRQVVVLVTIGTGRPLGHQIVRARLAGFNSDVTGRALESLFDVHGVAEGRRCRAFRLGHRESADDKDHDNGATQDQEDESFHDTPPSMRRKLVVRWKSARQSSLRSGSFKCSILAPIDNMRCGDHERPP